MKSDYEARLWNVIAQHPEIRAKGLLFSRRNEIATYVIPEVDRMVTELVAMIDEGRIQWEIEAFGMKLCQPKWIYGAPDLELDNESFQDIVASAPWASYPTPAWRRRPDKVMQEWMNYFLKRGRRR